MGKTAFKDTKMYQKKTAKGAGTEVKKKKKNEPSKTYAKQFSVIIPVYNVKQYLAEAIESVINQTVGFQKNVQLILIDDGSKDNSGIVCLKYALKYPENIVYRRTENRGVSAARNLGIDLAVGKYIAFLDGDDYFSKNLLAECGKFMEQNSDKIDCLFTDIEMFEAQQGKHPLRKGITKNQVISLDDGIVTGTGVAFHKSEVLKRFRFDETMAISEDFKLVASIMKEKYAYGHVASAIYYYRKRYSEDSAIDSIKDKNNIKIYKRVASCYKYLITDDLKRFGHVTQYTQKALAYDLSYFTKASSEEVLNSPEYAEAYEALLFCLNQIDDTVLITNVYASYWVKLFQFKIKYGELRIADNEIEPRFYIGSIPYKLGTTIWVELCEEKGGIIHFSGYYNALFSDLVELVVRYNDKEYFASCSASNFGNKQFYYFGKHVLSATQFDIYVPYETDGYMEFFMRTNGRRMPCDIKHTASSRFNNTTLGNQFFIDENTIFQKFGTNIISVKKFDFATLDYLLTEATYGYLKADTEIIEEYLRRYQEFIGRRIWIFSDLFERNDDNAWWLYKYAKQFDDGIEKYYMTCKRAKDWNVISKDKNVLDFDDIKDRVLLFFCEKSVSSHSIRNSFSVLPRAGDWSDEYNIFRALFRADEVFLQHGIIKDTCNYNYSYPVRNFSIFVTSTKGEYDYVCGLDFAYPPGIVKLTGLPRYDYLKNEAEKIIIFAPTWSRGGAILGQYSPAFKDSDKYKFIQSFINNKRLCENLRKNGYKVYCKLHPLLTVQMSDFYTDYDDVIKFVGEEITYNKIFKIGALFVTDYSSAFFDFAYLKKPILYYQEFAGHLNAEGSYFSYEDNGFGKVSYDFETLIDDVIECVAGGCKMPEKYQKRVDDFFTFRDKNNCKRVYDEILKLPIRKFAQSSEHKKPPKTKTAVNSNSAARATKSKTMPHKKVTAKTKKTKGDKKNGKK